MNKPTYRITLSFRGISPEEAKKTAVEIEREFKKRHWHQNVTCKWENTTLVLQAQNDFNEKGLALRDEFSDLITACAKEAFDGGIEILSVDVLASDQD